MFAVLNILLGNISGSNTNSNENKCDFDNGIDTFFPLNFYCVHLDRDKKLEKKVTINFIIKKTY